MKTNLSKKLPLFSALSLAVMVVALVMFFLFGFNVASQEADRKVISITYDSYITIDEDLEEEVEDTCKAVIKSEGCSYLYVRSSTISGGGIIEFAFDTSYDTSLLESVKDAMLEKLSTEGELANSTYEGVVQSLTSRSFSSYIGRAAIAGAVCAVFAFLYVLIRFGLAQSVVTLLNALHDSLLVVALALIFRIPVTTTFVAVVAFALVYSLINSMLSFVEVRRIANKEDVKLMAIEDSVALSLKAGKKASLKLAAVTAAALAVLGAVSAFTAFGITLMVVPAVIAVCVSLYSSFVFLPEGYSLIKINMVKSAAYKETYEYKMSKLNEDKTSKMAEKSEEDID